MSKTALSAVLVAALLGSPAAAAVVLLAKGQITGSAAGAGADLSGLTGPLENGVAGNVLGGIGSGLAYAGNNVFLATPDRGPNAAPYNAAVDNTTSYISRFQTLRLRLTANGAAAALPFRLDTKLTGTTLLSSPTPLAYGTGAGLGVRSDGTPLGSGAPAANTASAFYFSGRSDNFAAGVSGNPANGRFDPEAVRVSNDGRTLFISDEYGPYVRQFDRATGTLVRTFTLPGTLDTTLPGNLDVTNLAPTEAAEIAGNTSGRVANKGMEGLAISPDGTTLYGIMQAPLLQDAADPATKKLVRIVAIDIASGATREYGYTLTTGSGVSDIVAIDNTRFLVDERDGKGLGDGSVAKVKQAFVINLAGAVDITGLAGAEAAAAAVAKSPAPFLDIVAALGASGVTSDQVPAKIEGFAFGDDVTYDGDIYHTLFVANDNDFVPDVAGPSQFFVFGFRDSDLPGFTPQQIAAVPEPATWATMLVGLGAAGAMLRRRRAVTAPA